jgi:hypothetical protein
MQEETERSLCLLAVQVVTIRMAVIHARRERERSLCLLAVQVVTIRMGMVPD